MIVEVPNGVTIGSGLTEALPPPQPSAWIIRKKKTAASAALDTKCMARGVLRRFQPFLKAAIKKMKSTKSVRRRNPDNGMRRLGIEGGSAALPLVGTVTVKDTVAPFAADRLVGAWHVAPRGAPEQANETVPE